jgi:hypothetical protein
VCVWVCVCVCGCVCVGVCVCVCAHLPVSFSRTVHATPILPHNPNLFCSRCSRCVCVCVCVRAARCGCALNSVTCLQHGLMQKMLQDTDVAERLRELQDGPQPRPDAGERKRKRMADEAETAAECSDGSVAGEGGEKEEGASTENPYAHWATAASDEELSDDGDAAPNVPDTSAYAHFGEQDEVDEAEHGGPVIDDDDSGMFMSSLSAGGSSQARRAVNREVFVGIDRNAPSTTINDKKKKNRPGQIARQKRAEVKHGDNVSTLERPPSTQCLPSPEGGLLPSSPPRLRNNLWRCHSKWVCPWWWWWWWWWCVCVCVCVWCGVMRWTGCPRSRPVQGRHGQAARATEKAGRRERESSREQAKQREVFTRQRSHRQQREALGYRTQAEGPQSTCSSRR